MRMVLPRSYYGDVMYFLIKFVIRHRRLPTKQNIFSDKLFDLPRSKELGSPLRVFVSDKEYVKNIRKGSRG